LQRQIL